MPHQKMTSAKPARTFGDECFSGGTGKSIRAMWTIDPVYRSGNIQKAVCLNCGKDLFTKHYEQITYINRVVHARPATDARWSK